MNSESETENSPNRLNIRGNVRLIRPIWFSFFIGEFPPREKEFPLRWIGTREQQFDFEIRLFLFLFLFFPFKPLNTGRVDSFDSFLQQFEQELNFGVTKLNLSRHYSKTSDFARIIFARRTKMIFQASNLMYSGN